MAAEEKVVIKVEVDADISNDVAAIRNRLKAIEDRMGSFNRKSKDMDRGLDRVNKRFDKMGNVLRKVTQVFLKFTAALAKFSFIALAGQIGLFTAGLLAAKAALITGRAAVSAYQASLRGLSVAAAGVATALAVAAAAMRQFNEVQLGSQFGGGPQGRSNAIRATRSIDNRTAGLLGREATSAIAGSLGRAGARPSQTSNLVRQLFNISGGDAKAAQSLAAAIGSGDVKQAQTSLRGAVGFNQGSLKNVSSMQGLMGVVSGGGATGANFQSVGADMAQTFIGTLKTQFSGLTNIFADLGGPLIEPFRQAFVSISRILKEDILSMTAVLQKFGADSFAPTLVTTIDKISEFIRSNIVNNIGDVKEMGEAFVNFFKAVRDFFDDIGGYLVKLEPAADVVIEMFKAFGDAAGGRGLFQQFNNLVVENAEAFKDFGASIGNVIGALFDQLSGGQMGFFNKLPLLSDILDTLASEVIPALFNVFGRFAPILERLPDALSGLADVLNFLAPIIGTLVDAIAMVADLIGSFGMGMGLMFLGGRKMGMGGRMARAGAGAGAAGAGGLTARAGNGLFNAGAGLQARGFVGAGNVVGRTGIAMSGGAGGLLGKVAGPVGGVLSAMHLEKTVGNPFKLGFDDSGSAYQTGKFTGGGILAGAGVGATIGAMGGPFAPITMTAGILIGAAVGGIMEGVAAFRGNRRLKKAAENASVAILGGLTGGVLAGAGSASFNQGQSMLEMYQAAVSAAIDPETGELRVEGDTRQFRDFLRAAGVDPNSVHRDEMFKLLAEGGYGDQLERQLEGAVDFMDRQINNIAKALGMGAETVMQSLEALGIDPMSDFNDTAASGLVALLNSPVIDRSRLVLPDFSTSQAGVANRFDSASDMLNTLIGETNEGIFDDATVSDFVDRFAAAEIAGGMSADVAGLSGLKEIREKVASGELDAKVLSQFGIRDQEMFIFDQLEQQYGLGEGGAERLYESYSDGGFSIERVSGEIQRISTERERLRSGLIGGDIGAFAQVAGAEGTNAFKLFAMNKMFTGDRPTGDQYAFGSAFRTGDFDAVQAQLDEGYEGPSGKGAAAATVDFMIKNGFLQEAQIGLLQLISENTGNPVAFNITGEVSENNLTSGQVVFNIESIPGESADSGGNPGGIQRAGRGSNSE